MSKESRPKPFVKWVGGKTRMVGHIVNYLPEKINKYMEPFLGGGALFFELSHTGRFSKAMLGDMNPELVNAYNVIKSSLGDLIRELKSGKYIYCKSNYVDVRSWDSRTMSSIQRAARFIYLNRTCFNGLYRVNKNGHFNVPFGKYSNPLICDEMNLAAVSNSIRDVDVFERGFDWVLEQAKEGDVVYFDPPYYPLSGTAKFVSYTQTGFSPEDQKRLAQTFAELASKGVSTILSNSFCPETLALYEKFRIVELQGNRSIGGPASYRKPVQEIMVLANCKDTA